MRIFTIARQKLIEKNIDWHQVYTDKTRFLKRQYEDVVGQGSYFRFEGKANDGDEYYVILSPANIHKPRAKWFAGVRKLPATYSAGGKYFDSLDGAARYARETWGVQTPRELVPYTSAQLYGISQKVSEWKAANEKNEKNDETDTSEDDDSKKEDDDKIRKKKKKPSSRIKK